MTIFKLFSTLIILGINVYMLYMSDNNLSKLSDFTSQSWNISVVNKTDTASCYEPYKSTIFEMIDAKRYLSYNNSYDYTFIYISGLRNHKQGYYYTNNILVFSLMIIVIIILILAPLIYFLRKYKYNKDISRRSLTYIHDIQHTIQHKTKIMLVLCIMLLLLGSFILLLYNYSKIMFDNNEILKREAQIFLWIIFINLYIICDIYILITSINNHSTINNEDIHDDKEKQLLINRDESNMTLIT